MNDNLPIDLKTVAGLLGKRFFIPAYQRGYRWTVEQVTDLLKDINEFTPKEIAGTTNKTWYCLQPIVVKKSEKEIDVWNVIDGQQRLTTIYLILHYFNRRYLEVDRTPLFELSYETRPESARFLQDQLGAEEVSDKNIDFWHMTKAYESIQKWFKDAGPTFDRNNFESKFSHATRVIWYETVDKDEIAIFTRLNIGKIRLTDAELIKALFLNSSNFNNGQGDKVRFRQIEIASQWDAMEYALQQDSFWYFLTGGEDKLVTRIELIFRLMSEKPEEKEDYQTFSNFNERFKQHKSEQAIIDAWQEVRGYYQTLEEWFNDRYYYHIIGFLIATGTDIRDLLKLNEGKPTKHSFRKSLKTLVEDKVKAKLENIEYKKGPVRNILLLHNIITMLNNDESSRFPFDRYKREQWDIEHVSASAEKMPANEKHQEDWLKEAVDHLPEGELKQQATIYKKDSFQKIYEEIVSHFNERGESNEIANLTLLDANTNRGYGNSVFPVKRSKIIEKDRLGTFIPVCTRNVFMKFYNTQVEHMSFWGDTDRTAYLANIKQVLADYLPQ